jgi:ADP-ribose pyrophosphatase YjhB (NUDIX family)
MSKYEKPFIYCPYCGKRLDLIVKGRKACRCGFVHWDSPKPVVVCVVPMQHRWLRRAGISTRGIPDGGLLTVKRGAAPYKGRWCLPCGYMDRHGHPKAEAAREVREETGIIVRIEKIISTCNPLPGEVNITAIHYLARPVGGKLKAGDDAVDARVFTPEDMPTLCFHSHRTLHDLWYRGDLGRLTGKDLEL